MTCRPVQQPQGLLLLLLKYILLSSCWLFQSFRIQDPSSCVGFSANNSTYMAVTHSGPPFSPASNLSIFRLHADLNVTLVGATPVVEAGTFIMVL